MGNGLAHGLDGEMRGLAPEGRIVTIEDAEVQKLEGLKEAKEGVKGVIFRGKIEEVWFVRASFPIKDRQLKTGPVCL